MPRSWLRQSMHTQEPRLHRAKSVQDRLADYSEAMALAEAGEQALAATVLSPPAVERKRILVIGHGCSFSSRLRAYALSVAERMGSDVMLLSVGASSADQAWRESFAHLAAQAASEWVKHASTMNLHVSHEIRFGSLEQAVSELVRSCGRIEFILSEPKEGEQVMGQTGLALFTVK
ncbi:hypothetical protein MASR1M90_05450 [Desulfovibrionales bacterium]